MNLKTIKTKLLATIIISAFAVYSCNKDDDTTMDRNTEKSQMGSLDVRMTDAPANFTAVNVEVIGLEIQHRDTSGPSSGWKSLSTNAGIYNLLELQDSISVLIANTDSFPVGNINQLRMILGDSNTVEIDSIFSFDLTTPSAQQTGLKLNVNAEIRANQKTEILLDFDAEKSIIVTGDSTFKLKPVIKVKEVKYF